MAGAKGQRSFPPCGTIAAYRMHLRYGPPPCEECRKANRAKSVERRAQMCVCSDCGRLMQLAATYRCDWCYKKLRRSRPKRKKAPRVEPMVGPAVGGEVLDEAPAVPDPEQP